MNAKVLQYHLKSLQAETKYIVRVMASTRAGGTCGDKIDFITDGFSMLCCTNSFSIYGLFLMCMELSLRERSLFYRRRRFTVDGVSNSLPLLAGEDAGKIGWDMSICHPSRTATPRDCFRSSHGMAIPVYDYRNIAFFCSCFISQSYTDPAN